MSHPEQIKFISLIKQHFPAFFENKKVLEVGALDINGSVRNFFVNCDYTGIDLEVGKGVDIVVPGQLIDFPSQSFDVTISCECFEHNPFWLETFVNMLRMTKAGGIIVITCACYGRPEHGTSLSYPEDSPLTVKKGWEYYRNLSGYDFQQRIALGNWFSIWQFYHHAIANDLYFIGIVKGQESTNYYSQTIEKIALKYANFYNILYEKACFLLSSRSKTI